MNKIQIATIAFALTEAALSSGMAQAEPTFTGAPPRGPEIRDSAGACGIGEFPQLGKAGHYNGLCTTLTDAEKCLAVIKRHMSSEGVLHPTHFPDARVEYCLETFRSGLLKSAE